MGGVSECVGEGIALGGFNCKSITDNNNNNCIIPDGTSCQLNEFRCANGKKCIDETKRCDHWNDCGDGDTSDEENCEFPPCSAGHFRCTNAICIPIKWLCDGHSDCADAIDEANCSMYSFQHAISSLIFSLSLFTATVSCPDTKFLCPVEKKCISRDKLCDEVADCSDGADEKDACC